VPFRLPSTDDRINWLDLAPNFASLQILGQPSKSLRKSLVHEVGDIALASAGQFCIPLGFFPIALRSLRSAFHFNTPFFPRLMFNSEMGRPDEGDKANGRLNQAESEATDRPVCTYIYRSAD
jgi:hypothetical protein